MKKLPGRIAALAVIPLVLAACGGDPLDSSADSSSSGSGIIIGSADFAESQLIATIYSQALQDAGVEVTEKLNIGSREVYYQAVQDGSIDLVPDYSGALLRYLDPESTETTTDDVISALQTTLPDDVSMLDHSEAQDKDVLAVTQETAQQYDLTTISDLQPVASQLVLGGPPEWQTRVNGVVGLQDVYGLQFSSFLPLDAGGPLTLAALTSGQIQVADVFSTDPAITENDLVALDDDKSLFAAENILPIMRSDKVTDQVSSVLNAISAALTTEDLIAMNGRAADGESLDTIARDWLSAHDVS